MRKVLFMPIIAALVLVAGCAGFGLQQPKTFTEKLGYAYTVHTAVLEAAAVSVGQREISSDDGLQILKIADESRQVLDAARIAANAGDITTAEGKLALGVTILEQLQAYLRSRGRSP